VRIPNPAPQTPRGKKPTETIIQSQRDVINLRRWRKSHQFEKRYNPVEFFFVSKPRSYFR
jgi:hypothetical protein